MEAKSIPLRPKCMISHDSLSKNNRKTPRAPQKKHEKAVKSNASKGLILKMMIERIKWTSPILFRGDLLCLTSLFSTLLDSSVLLLLLLLLLFKFYSVPFSPRFVYLRPFLYVRTSYYLFLLPSIFFVLLHQFCFRLLNLAWFFSFADKFASVDFFSSSVFFFHPCSFKFLCCLVHFLRSILGSFFDRTRRVTSFNSFFSFFVDELIFTLASTLVTHVYVLHFSRCNVFSFYAIIVNLCSYLMRAPSSRDDSHPENSRTA